MPAQSSIAAAAREFIRDPSSVGSAFPASRSMVDRTLGPIDWTGIDLMVELGPGTGRFTFEALRRMKPEARLLAIEPGDDFVDHLRHVGDDERLLVAKGRAQNLRDIMHAHGFARADCILSGLPFSTLAEPDAITIVEQCRVSLTPQGLLVAYQMRREIERFLSDRFEIILKRYALWNIPPCHLYWARPMERD